MKKFHLNPILRKELKLGARTFRFPLAVALYAMFFTFISMFLFLDNTNTFSYIFYGGGYSYIDYASLTEGFRILAVAQVIMICIIVPVLTAGTIAGERERQTLDIMLTAPVHSFSIAWGKLMAALANVFIFIISTLPAMSICFLYGGINWKYLFVFLVQIMALAFFIGSIGVWASAFFKKTIVAVIITLIYEAVFYGLPFVIYGVIYVIKMNIWMATHPNGTGNLAVKMGWSGLIFLFSPIITTINSIMTSTSSVNVVEEVLSAFTGTTTFAKAFDYALSGWNYIGFVVMILIGFLFLLWTSKHIDAPGRQHGRKAVAKN